MSPLGPQQFDVDVSDQLYRTYNPDDPIIGIAVTATVPVIIPWNLGRTGLEQDKDGEDKKVTFGEIRWSEAGPGPHDVFGEKIGGHLEKIATVEWSVKTTCYQTVQATAGHHRWLITPCPILLRTYSPLNGAPKTEEVMKNPQPCPGSWVTTPPQVTAILVNSQGLPPMPVTKATVEQLVTAMKQPVADSAKKKKG